MVGWVEEFIEEAVKSIRSRVKGRALAAVSGGVDSTTAAVLARIALKDRLSAVFIDTGYMRADEAAKVKEALSEVLPLKIYDYSGRFYQRTFGVADAEAKRKAFRDVFYTVLSEIARMEGCKWIIQGTIAPDWIETMGGIKTQHNVLKEVGLDPLRTYGFEVVEPLRELYKSEVREVARALGVPSWIAERQPFPGPGLLVRIVGEADSTRVKLVREACKIVEEELRGYGYSQYFAAVSPPPRSTFRDYELKLKLEEFPARATGVKGDVRAYSKIIGVADGVERAYEEWRRIVWKYGVSRVVARISEGKGEHAIFIRAVITRDFMTARVPQAPETALGRIVERLQEVKGVGPIYWEVTPKPPATIEYE